jgi:hypothetical protein
MAVTSWVDILLGCGCKILGNWPNPPLLQLQCTTKITGSAAGEAGEEAGGGSILDDGVVLPNARHLKD